MISHNGSIGPPLKWAGAKRWQIPHLTQYWQRESHRRLVEPFCGGLAVALGLMPERALLNDVNPHLINFYSWLKQGLRITIEMRYDEPLFYRHRARFNELLRASKHETREAAALFYYLNRTAYNGLCRFNQSGEFNVPFGKYTTINYRHSFQDYKSVFAGWQFSAGSFDRLKLKSNDFVYADPPYDVLYSRVSACV